MFLVGCTQTISNNGSKLKVTCVSLELATRRLQSILVKRAGGEDRVRFRGQRAENPHTLLPRQGVEFSQVYFQQKALSDGTKHLDFKLAIL